MKTKRGEIMSETKLRASDIVVVKLNGTGDFDGWDVVDVELIVNK